MWWMESMKEFGSVSGGEVGEIDDHEIRSPHTNSHKIIFPFSSLKGTD